MNACPRCGVQIETGAMFCSSCGCSFAAPASGGMALIPVRATNRLAFAAAAILLVGCLAFALGASGIIRGKTKSSSGLAQEKAFGASGLTRKASEGASGISKTTSSSDSGVTQMSTPQNVPMPDDIRDWLEHLRRTEERRVELAQDQLGQAMRMATMLSLGGAEEFLQGLLNDPESDPDQPHNKVKVDVEEMKAAWIDLRAFFNSKQPPEECRFIYNEYDPALGETGAFISDILGPLSGSIEDKQDQDSAIAKLLKMQNRSKQAIDEPAIRADEGVAKICDKYDTPKWFKIRGDIGGGGGLTQFPAGVGK